MILFFPVFLDHFNYLLTSLDTSALIVQFKMKQTNMNNTPARKRNGVIPQTQMICTYSQGDKCLIALCIIAVVGSPFVKSGWVSVCQRWRRVHRRNCQGIDEVCSTVRESLSKRKLTCRAQSKAFINPVTFYFKSVGIYSERPSICREKPSPTGKVTCIIWPGNIEHYLRRASCLVALSASKLLPQEDL